MGAKVKIKVHSGEVKRFLKENPGLKAALEEKGKQGLQYARSIAPVETGRYRDSLYYTIFKGPNGMSVRIGSDSGLAAYLEFGTEHMSAQHVLGRTIDSIR